tara:strand:+ start:770 stop:982 length:213 start_codon:yes stop_codon:yes gene_type:complete
MIHYICKKKTTKEFFMHITFEDLIASVIFIVSIGVFILGLSWAHQREVELGISHMSSERILVHEELKNKN